MELTMPVMYCDTAYGRIFKGQFVEPDYSLIRPMYFNDTRDI